jgi:mannosyl-3-phosphoglycerate phosphatase
MNKTLNNDKKYLVFTDLDGTLLDAEDYSYTAASEAIDFLRAQKIPIIPCTSKTHLEVERIGREIGLSDPFIVENGSAVFCREHYFDKGAENFIKIDGFDVLLLGKRYQAILELFRHLKIQYESGMKGFHEMDVEEIVFHTGLTIREAEIAKDRRFSEPFILKKQSELSEELYSCVHDQGYRILKGNRFYHLIGKTDKGKAVKALTGLFEQNSSEKFCTIGIGDSANDLEMLKAVDIPFQVKKTDHTYDPHLDVDGIYRTNNIGPAGWQEAIFKTLD